jgi:hypothetical protein
MTHELRAVPIRSASARPNLTGICAVSLEKSTRIQLKDGKTGRRTERFGGGRDLRVILLFGCFENVVS